MTKWMTVAAAALVAASAGVVSGRAQEGSSGRVSFQNRTDHAVWVTIYRKRDRGDKRAYGCVSGGEGNGFNTSTSAYSGYFLLLEVKSDKKSCGGGNIWTMEATKLYANHGWFIDPVPGRPNEVKLTDSLTKY